MTRGGGTRLPLLLALLSAAGAIVASVAGIADQDIYRPFTPEGLMPGTLSQDVVSLLAALGVLVCVPLARRGSRKPRLVMLGLLGYLLYAYATYCFEGICNGLYILYIAVLGLSVYSIILLLRDAGSVELRVKEGRRIPRRSLALFLLLLALLFTVMWLSILVPSMMERTCPEAATILVLDLSFFIPLLVVEAWMLMAGRRMGAFLALPILVKLSALGISVLLGALLAPLYGMPLEPSEVAVYAFMGLLPAAFAIPFLVSLRASEGERDEHRGRNDRDADNC